MKGMTVMLIKKRQFLTATLVVALAAAVFVNWYYTESSPENGTSQTVTTEHVSGNLGDSLYVGGTTAAADQTEVNQQEYFAQAKLKRINTHDEIIDSIEEIIDEEGVTADNIKRIEQILNEFKTDVKAETDAENLISAKTSCECLVIINDDCCQVVMEKNSLNDTVILQITEIISKNTNISAENLTIIEIK